MNNVHRDGHYSKEEYHLPRDRNDDNTVYTMADAVFSAAFLNTCLKNCDVVGMACFSPVVNTRGGICTYKDGLVLRPTYYVFKLYANLLGDEILNSWSEEAQNLSLEGITSDIKMVDYVMTMKDGKYVAAIVNKDPEKSQEISFRFLEDQPGFVTVHTLNGKSKDSYNDIGHKDAIIRTAEEAVFDGKICVEPHSVTVVEFR